MATGTLTNTTIAARYLSLLKLTGTGNDVLAADASAKYIEDGNGNDSVLSLSTTRVGIGNTAPTALLTAGAITTLLTDGTTAVTPEGVNVHITEASKYAMGIKNADASGDGLIIQAGDASDDFALRVEDYDSANDLLVVQGGGNVGIGTATPASLLDISGSSSDTDWTDNSGLAASVPSIMISNSANEDDTFCAIQMSPTEGGADQSFGIIAQATEHGSDSGTNRDDYSPKVHFVQRTDANEYEAALTIDEDANVGIGTSAPDGLLEISKDASNPVYLSTYHDTITTTAGLYFRKAGNTEASPQVVHDNEVLGEIRFQGIDANGGTFRDGAVIVARTNGTPGSSDMPTDLEFYVNTGAATAAIQAMTIAETGYVGINESSPSFRLDVQDSRDANFVARFQNTHATGYGVLVKLGHTNPDTGDPFIAFYDSADQQEGSITTNGSNPGIVLNNPSDRRLKENIVTIPDGLSLISKIKPRNFKWKEGDGKIAYGFIADEIDEVFPDMVQGQRDGDGKLIPDAMKEIDGKEVVDRQSVSTDAMIPMLVKAIQELSAKVTALENA